MAGYVPARQLRARVPINNLDYQSLEIHDNEQEDQTYNTGEDEGMIEEEQVDRESLDDGGSRARPRRGRNTGRSRAPSPEEAPDRPVASSSRGKKKATEEEETIEAKASQFSKEDSAGRCQWFVRVKGIDIPTETFRIAEKDLSVKWALLLKRYRSLSRKDRRVQYNNVFQNYWDEYKRRSRRV